MARMCTSVGCALTATWPDAGCLMLQVMASVAAALRRAVEVAGPRLVEAHYAVQIATTAAGLDAAASVIKARRGQVLKTEPREGQDLFVITASVPVEACLSNRRPHIDDDNADDGDGLRPDQSTGQVGAEADRAGFAEELRQASSGAAAATLAPSHWDRLQVEMKPPYGIPLALQHVLICCYVLFWASIAAINCSCCLLQWLCCAEYVAGVQRCHRLPSCPSGTMSAQVAPTWRPVSEEEREEHGEGGILVHNLAQKLANKARARKGLPLLGAKVVGDATKQRTRARKV